MFFFDFFVCLFFKHFSGCKQCFALKQSQIRGLRLLKQGLGFCTVLSISVICVMLAMPKIACRCEELTILYVGVVPAIIGM